MSIVQAKLTQLETRLQTLVEGSLTRLLPFRGGTNNLPHQLVEAMRAGIQTQSDGNLLAPNLFTLTVHPAYAQVLRENSALLEDLAEVIRQTGEEAGLYFYTSPFIKIISDPGIPDGQVRIHAQCTPQDLDDTGTLAFESKAGARSIPEAAFLIIGGSQVLPLSQPVINIGRHPDNHIVLDDLRVSRLHAQLRAIKGRYTIFDLDSTGGTFVNDQRVQQVSLYPGDVISLAGVVIVYGQETSPQPGSDENSTRPMEFLPPEA